VAAWRLARAPVPAPAVAPITPAAPVVEVKTASPPAAAVAPPAPAAGTEEPKPTAPRAVARPPAAKRTAGGAQRAPAAVVPVEALPRPSEVKLEAAEPAKPPVPAPAPAPRPTRAQERGLVDENPLRR
jgi:hypothetical protein